MGRVLRLHLDPLAAVFAPGAASDAAARASAEARLAAPLSQLDAYLSAKKFLVGDTPTLADVAVVGSLANLMRHVVGGAARGCRTSRGITSIASRTPRARFPSSAARMPLR